MWVHDLAGRSGALDEVMSFAARNLVYLAAVLLLAMWTRRSGLRAVLAAGIGAALALLIAQLLGAAWVRPRPFVAEHFTPLIPHAADGSFPSDHLCALGAVAAGAWLASRALGLLAVLLAVVVGFARVYAGVHYGSDVLAGFAIGAVCALLTWWALGPLMPHLDRLDAQLQRRRLRPA
jgi:undecaprenyl-diphosphatase